MLADKPKDRLNRGFDCPPECRGHGVPEFCTELFDAVEGCWAAQESIGECFSEEEQSSGSVVGLGLKLLLTRQAEGSFLVAVHDGFVPREESVTDLVRFAPALFR